MRPMGQRGLWEYSREVDKDWVGRVLEPLNFICLYVCLCKDPHMCRCLGKPERDSAPLEMELQLQVDVSHPVWIWELNSAGLQGQPLLLATELSIPTIPLNF